MRIPSIVDLKYFATLYDASAAVSVVRFIQTNDHSGQYLKKMIIEMESVAANPGNFRRTWMDNGGEYVSKAQTEWINTKAIIQ